MIMLDLIWKKHVSTSSLLSHAHASTIVFMNQMIRDIYREALNAHTNGIFLCLKLSNLSALFIWFRGT